MENEQFSYLLSELNLSSEQKAAALKILSEHAAGRRAEEITSAQPALTVDARES